MTKLKDIIKLKTIAIASSLILSLCAVLWTTLKDVISTGAETKFKEKMIYFIKSEEAKTFIIDSLIDVRIKTTMSDPIVWIDILSSSHIEKFAENKAIEVKEQVAKQIMREDSLKGDMVHSLGEGTGMRNEDVLPQMIKLLKAFKEGRLYISRTVRADF